MKSTPFFAALALALGFVAGCAHLDLTPESDPQRVVTGNVTLRDATLFPPEAVLTVRVIDRVVPEVTRNPMATATPASSSLERQPEAVERILGEQVIHAPGATPIPFRIEFAADDATMRRGVALDARIAFDGKVRYRSLEAGIVTLSSLMRSNDVPIEPAK